MGWSYYGSDVFHVIRICYWFKLFKKPVFTYNGFLVNRIIRIYPIYLVAVLLTILFFRETVQSIIGNLFFAQNVASSTLVHDNALWSLNHEVVYYGLVMPILRYRIKLAPIFVGIFILLIVSITFSPFPLIIEGYLVGFTFWLTGFGLSKTQLNTDQQVASVSVNKLISAFLLLIASEGLNGIRFLTKTVKLAHASTIFEFDYLVQFGDFASYLFCLYTLLVVSGFKFAYSRLITFLVYALCLTAIIQLILSGDFFGKKYFYVPLLLFLGSCFFRLIKKPLLNPVPVLVYLGGISYAIYVMHLPIMYLIGKAFAVDNTVLVYAGRVGLVFFLPSG